MNDEPTVQETGAENGSEQEVATRPHSRRTLLTGAAAGLAGAAAAALASATPAGADNASGHVTIANGNNGTGNNAGAAITSITADPGATSTFAAYNTSAGGSGIYGQGFASSSIANDYNAGIVGDTSTGDGVLGFSSGSHNSNGNGVHGVYGGTVSGDISGCGVYGESTDGPGVYGISSDVASEGVVGENAAGTGVSGVSVGESGVYLGIVAGVIGDSTANVGVLGTSSVVHGLLGVTKGNNASGTYGSDVSPAGGFGVYGVSDAGIGVYAETTGTASTRPALWASAGGKGPAILAQPSTTATLPTVQSSSAGTQPAIEATGKAVPTSGSVLVAGNGPAIKVQGVASFTRSGVATLSAAGTSVLVPIPGGLSATSHVVATVQAKALGTPGTVSVLSVFPNPATGKAAIYFTGSAPVGTKVAWFVFG